VAVNNFGRHLQMNRDFIDVLPWPAFQLDGDSVNNPVDKTSLSA